MKQLFFGLIAFLLTLTDPSLAQSSEETKTFQPITLMDGLNREISIDAPVERVVTLLPALSEIVCALGDEEKLVARDLNSDYPATIEELPIISNPDMSLNYEQLIALEPDMIFASDLIRLDQIADLEKLGLSVYWLNEPESFEEMYESIHEIALVLGRENEADSLCENLESRRQVVLDKMESVDTFPAVFFEIDGSDPSKPWTAGKGSFIDELIREAGGHNIAGKTEGAWLQIATEFLIIEDPEIILLADAEYGTTPESVKARDGWGSIHAIRENAIYEIDPDIFSRPGPRLVNALESLAMLFHPELFSTK